MYRYGGTPASTNPCNASPARQIRQVRLCLADMNLPPLAADQPGLIEVLFTPEAMSLWELVRLHRSPITLLDLSTASGMEPTRVQRHLDALLQQGLVQTVRPRKPRTTLGYVVTRQQIVVGCNLEDQAFMERMQALNLQANRMHFQDVLDRFGDPNADRLTTWRFGAYGTAYLEVEDLRELARRVRAVHEFVDMVASKHAASPRVTGQHFRPRHCNHAICIRIEPLQGPVLAQPEISMVPQEHVSQAIHAGQRTSGLGTLAPREQEVARAMAAGHPRKRIATHLGISLHTVGTMAKRIFRKLGVHSHAELVAVLTQDPTPPAPR
ncbi:MAG: hypothetical protein RLZZ558_562 [Planctomycetota bacterium]